MRKTLLLALGLWFAVVQVALGEAAKSTIEDQKSVALTVYNVGLGLVKDVRELGLGTGTVELKFMDVASQIDATSVHIKSLTAPSSLSILEQNYEYDLLNPTKLLSKYIDQPVKLLFKNMYTGEEKMRDAVLLSTNEGQIYKIGDEIHINPGAQVILPRIPENLIAKPTLVWLLNNSRKEKQSVEASYLTNGITWKANYVAVIDKEDKKSDLTGWVTIENTSGATYKNASLKLVAGDVHRVTPPPMPMMKSAMGAAIAMEERDAPQFVEQSFFEYHLYTLQRPSTVKDNETKQLSLLEAADVPVKKLFVFQGQESFFMSQYPEPFGKQKVATLIEIANKKENNLGMPLPKGVVRVYKADTEGNLQFIGEDEIDHTPKDEKIKVKMGEAFDVVAERKQTDWRVIASHIYESEWEISLRNHKEEPVEVLVRERVPGDWQVLNSTHEYTKEEAHTIEFKVPVPKNQEVKVKYRVRVRF